MDLKRDLFLGLVTYPESKYKDYNGSNLNFIELVNFLEVSNYQINNKNYIIDSSFKKMDLSTYAKNSFSLIVNMLSILLVKFYSIKNINLLTLSRSTLNDSIVIFKIIHRTIVYFLTLGKSKKLNTDIIRQTNISCSHRDLIQKAFESGCKWALILEDDFIFDRSNNFKSKIQFCLKVMTENPYLVMTNISKSFSIKQMGIEGIINKKLQNLAHPGDEFVTLNHPITNTLCSTIYDVRQLQCIHNELKKLGIYSHIPVDHQLNIVLWNLVKKRVFSRSCYSSYFPGIFIQGSLCE
jgi:hypothetical protein